MEAVRVGAPDLRVLHLNHFDSWGFSTVAQQLRHGACPRLEVLELGHSSPDDARELMKALQGGAPCRQSLQRVKVCGVVVQGKKDLGDIVAAITREKNKGKKSGRSGRERIRECALSL